MALTKGYLASLLNVPPLVFRFQFNPDMLQEKRTYKYKEANSFGNWRFDRTQAGQGFFGTVSGLYDDVKEFGSLLVATKPLEAEEGEPRTIALDFVLDATVDGRSLEPELATLRSFVNPSWDLIDVAKLLFKGEVGCWSRPPECSFVYGGLSLSCVMTDLNIKMTSFFEKDVKPSRVEVSATLREQTSSVSTILDFAKRNYSALGLRSSDSTTPPAPSGVNAVGGVLEDMFK